MLYHQLLSPNLIKKAWEDIYNSKDDDVRLISKGIDNVSLKKFKKNIDDNLSELLASLGRRDYKFQPLKGEFRKKKSGGFRLLTVPTVRDRIVHRAILYIITPELFKFINTGVSYCGIRKSVKKDKDNQRVNLKKAVRALAENLEEKNFFIFETDIEGFFDNVSKAKLLKKIKVCLSDNSLNSLLAQIIYFELGNKTEILSDKRSLNVKMPKKNRGISQGSALSPLFSNVYLADFDLLMKKVCGRTLIRYVDDFIIMGKSQNEVACFGRIAEKLLFAEGLKLSLKKTHDDINLKINSLVFLGLKFTRHKIQCSKTDKEVMEKFDLEIINPKKYIKHKRIVNGVYEEISVIEQINEKIVGWVKTYQPYHMDNVLDRIQDLIENRQKRDNRLAGIIAIDSLKKTNPLIRLSKWQELFSS